MTEPTNGRSGRPAYEPLPLVADEERARLLAIRERVEVAHREVQAAQKLAYEGVAPLRVRLALNRVQNTLIKLLVHRLPHPPLARSRDLTGRGPNEGHDLPA